MVNITSNSSLSSVSLLSNFFLQLHLLFNALSKKRSTFLATFHSGWTWTFMKMLANNCPSSVYICLLLSFTLLFSDFLKGDKYQ